MRSCNPPPDVINGGGGIAGIPSQYANLPFQEVADVAKRFASRLSYLRFAQNPNAKHGVATSHAGQQSGTNCKNSRCADCAECADCDDWKRAEDFGITGERIAGRWR